MINHDTIRCKSETQTRLCCDLIIAATDSTVSASLQIPVGSITPHLKKVYMDACGKGSLLGALVISIFARNAGEFEEHGGAP